MGGSSNISRKDVNLDVFECNSPFFFFTLAANLKIRNT